MSLTSKQRQYLKGLGHALSPVLQIGKEGINERQLASISKTLDDHELVKINILETSELNKNEAAEKICEPLKAELVQVIGKKMLLYKKNKKAPKIVLPIQSK
jgi:RNA-binding protein